MFDGVWCKAKHSMWRIGPEGVMPSDSIGGHARADSWSASGPRGNNLECFQDFNRQVEPKLWPKLVYMCHILSTAG